MTTELSQDSLWKRIVTNYKYYWIAFLVVFIDQLSKLTVKFSMTPGEDMEVLGEVFRINFIENKGAAFGLTIADLFNKVGLPMSDNTAKILLTVFSIAAVIVIVYLLQQIRHYKSKMPFFLALILGGAVGNIIDRVFYGVWFSGMNWYEGGLFHGRVVDMFYLDFYEGEIWGMSVNLLPVFNIADLAISIGIITVIVFQRRFFRRHLEIKQAQESV